MNNKTSFVPMAIIATLFFIFGFVTWLNGSLIPFLKVLCDLNDFEALFVTFAFYISYTVMALPMALLLEKTGYKNAMAIGLLVMAIGSLLFIPAALTGEFYIFLVALFSLGTGLTILQTASNPYVVLVGPMESAAMRISIMGLINKSAGVLAPLAFSAYVLSGIGSIEYLSTLEMDTLANKLIKPYIMMAIILIGLALLIKFSALPELKFEEDPYDDESIFAFPQVVLGSIALFFYVGVEVIAGDTIGLYAQNLGVLNATSLTSYSMAFMVFSYLIGIFLIPKYLSQEKALIGSAILGIMLLFGVAFSSIQSSAISEIIWGWSGIATLPNSVAFVALLGLANALVWPTIWPLALKDLGKHTAKGSALLIMAIAGGALIPLAYAKLAQWSGNAQVSYLIGVVSYAFILAYGLKLHKIKSWKR